MRYDRHECKYSFIARWIFIEETISPEEFKVESIEERKTWYYSSPQPFEDELLAVLEKGEFEEKLFHVRNNLRPEILKQMAVTVQLTNEQKGNLFFKQFQLKTICFIHLILPGRNCSIAAIEKEIDKAPVTAKVFKLGMRHETFINQYSSNPLALDKKPATEEIDKQRYFSLKFSSTGCSGFQWPRRTYGNILLQHHSQLPAFLMRPNWPSMRQSWIAVVHSCVSSFEFGRLVSVLVANIRPVVFTQVWHKSLGHIRLHRQTAVGREEKKEIEKKEKCEKELEEEMHRFHVVHHTKGLKHSVSIGNNLNLYLNRK